MRVVVTGAGGLVGRAVVRRWGATGLEHSDLDITDRAAVARTIAALDPDLIVNCAVLGVDECERDPARARAINVDGPAILAERARALVQFSSNYVFEGKDEVFYLPGDEANPVNVYGKTKLDGERAVAARCPRAFIVRTSWVFGAGKGSFVSSVHRRLRARERVRAVADIRASATWVEDLIDRLEVIVNRGEFGIQHVVNEGVCSNETFAREAARLVGADPTLIEPVSAREVHAAPRPRYTPLRALPPLRHWREALAAYIQSDAGGTS